MSSSHCSQENFSILSICKIKCDNDNEDCKNVENSCPPSPSCSENSICILIPGPKRSPQVEVITLSSESGSDPKSDPEDYFNPEDVLEEAWNMAQRKSRTQILEVGITYKSDSNASICTIPYSPSSPTSWDSDNKDAETSSATPPDHCSDIADLDDINIDYDALPSGSDYDTPYSPSDSPYHFSHDQTFPSPPPKKVTKFTNTFHPLFLSKSDSCFPAIALQSPEVSPCQR